MVDFSTIPKFLKPMLPLKLIAASTAGLLVGIGLCTRGWQSAPMADAGTKCIMISFVGFAVGWAWLIVTLIVALLAKAFYKPEP